MAWFPESKERLPLTWWKGQPIYLAAIIALSIVGSMILTAFVLAADRSDSIIGGLAFYYPSLLKGWVWTVVTYPLVNHVNLWLVLNAFFFWRFGEDVERYLGRKSFVMLLVTQVIAIPLTISLLALTGVAILPPVLGADFLMMGTFVAFVTLYPSAEFFGFKAWIVATVILGIDALQLLSGRSWAGLILLATEVFAAHGYVRYQQGRGFFPRWKMPSRSKQTERKPAAAPAKKAKEKTVAAANGRVTEEQVDAILDKINQHGFQSLTPEEKRILEKASENLGKGNKG